MEPTNEELILINQILEKLLSFKPKFNHRHLFEDWFETVGLSQLGYSWTCGSTKFCIFHKDLKNWIFKINTDTGYYRNYAEMEYNNYKLAEERGLEKYFATTIYLGEFCGNKYFL